MLFYFSDNLSNFVEYNSGICNTVLWRTEVNFITEKFVFFKFNNYKKSVDKTETGISALVIYV